MVGILTLAPLLLESLLALVDGHLVVEIPLAVVRGVCRCRRPVALVSVALRPPALQGPFHLGLQGLVALLLFFLLQFFYDAVDGGQAVFLRHVGQFLQGVLQMDGIGIWHQFVEHLRTDRQFLVVGALSVQQTDGFAIAALGIVVFLFLPVETTQPEQQYALLDAIAGSLLIAFLVGGDGLGGVTLHQVDIADGIVHLVEIVLVVV